MRIPAWMTPRAAACGPLLLLTACPDKVPTPAPSPSAPSGSGAVFKVGSVDALSNELAERTQERLGRADDFQVIVTQAAYGIGTLMRPGRTIPIDYTACAPASTPPLVPTPSLFPSFALSRETAAQFGLDDAVLNGIASAGGNISRTSGIVLQFADSAISTLSDRDIRRLIATPACAELLREGSVLMVRGYVFGRRTFRFDRTQANDANVRLTKVASFDVKLADGTSGVTITDSGPVGFLQIVSAIALKPAINDAAAEASSPPADRDASSTAASAAAPAVVGRPTVVARAVPADAPRAGRVYVQRDAADTTGADKRIVAALQAANLRVVPHIEAIDSAKMPSVAQVRYFNDGDIGVARTALGILQQDFPAAKMTRVPLPSPPGQLEVWLPRAGATATQPLAVRRNPAAASILLKP